MILINTWYILHRDIRTRTSNPTFKMKLSTNHSLEHVVLPFVLLLVCCSSVQGKKEISPYLVNPNSIDDRAGQVLFLSFLFGNNNNNMLVVCKTDSFLFIQRKKTWNRKRPRYCTEKSNILSSETPAVNRQGEKVLRTRILKCFLFLRCLLTHLKFRELSTTVYLRFEKIRSIGFTFLLVLRV